MAALNYNHLRYFWAVARDGNLTRTAARLNLSQSALSAQIRTLEARLGHALFERAGRELRLTEAGRIALDHAETIFSTGEELVGALGGAGRARQALRVGALATLSRNFTLGFLRPLLGRADVEIVLRSGGTGELLAALTDHVLDVVLVNRVPPDDAAASFVVHRLAEQQVGLIGTPRLAEPAPLPALLAERPLILPTRGSGIRHGFDALADRLGVRPQIAAEIDDMAMMRLLAREDAGLAVMPPIVARDELRSGALVEAARLSDIAETFLAVTAPRRFPNPLLRGLLTASPDRFGEA